MSTVQQIQQPGQSQQQIASIVHQQNISTWNAYYQEQAQRNSLPVNTPAAYFQNLPIAARHSFHQEESTIYQNCQGVAMEQHYGQTIAARSPTRRPESPPPLRNYHQTMVLIPYNTEYAQITADQLAAQHFQHQNILEYQQVRRSLSFSIEKIDFNAVLLSRRSHNKQFECPSAILYPGCNCMSSPVMQINQPMLNMQRQHGNKLK